MEKERRTKALLLSTLVVVVATLSIAFAVMSRTLSINGIAKMDTASWSVYFDNLSNAKITRGAEEVGKPNISTIDNGILENINVKLSNPKDEISYTVDIVNDGTIDAEITMIKDIELTDAQKKVFEFKVTYTETGEVLKDGDLLPADSSKNITINIKFKDDITEEDLPTESQTINLSYQITYTQYDGGNSDLPIGPNDGEVTPSKPRPESTIAKNFLRYTTSENKIESITFLSEYKAIENAKETWDASEARDNSVIGSYTDIDSNGMYEVYIGGTNGVYAPADCMDLFEDFSNLKEINFNGNFDTSNVTTMNGMFWQCINLTSLDLSGWDTSNVTDMDGVFSTCENLTSLDLSGWDTSNVTDMSYMFEFTSLTSLDISNFDTSNVRQIDFMFSDCTSLISLDLSSFDTSNVTDMSSMFHGCSSLTTLDLSGWDTSNVTSMYSMFSGCSSLTSLDLSSFDTSNVKQIDYMFSECTSLTTLKFNNAVLSGKSGPNMFYSVPAGITIYVKDTAAQNYIKNKIPDANVIIEPLAS